MPIRTYRYHIRHPHFNAEKIAEQMMLGHRYSNVLVEIERGRRAAIRQLLAETEKAARGPLVEATEAARRAVDAMLEEVTTWRKKNRKKTIPSEMRQRLDDSRIALRDAFQALKKAREEAKALGEDVGVKAEVERINRLSHELLKNARAYSGLYWGTYLVIEEAADAARKAPLWDKDGPHDPRFRRWDGTGVVAVQFQEALGVDNLFGGKDTRISIDPVTAFDGSPKSSKRCAKEKKTKLRLRIGTVPGKKQPIFGEWDMLLHKEIPPGSSIRWAEVRRVRVADRFTTDCEPVLKDSDVESYRWFLYLTVDVPEEKVHRHNSGSGSVAVNMGWRLLESGDVRVGYYVGTDGEEGEIVVPKLVFDRFAKVDSLRGIRAENLNRLKSDLGLVLKAGASKAPSWFLQQVSTLDRWRSADRTHAFWSRWRQNRWDGDQGAFLILDRYVMRDVHLWRWEAHLRNKVLGHRRAMYQNVAANLARKYETLIVDNSNLRSLAEGSRDSDNPNVSIYRQAVSPFELRTCLVNAFYGRASFGVAKNITVRHAACGSMEDVDGKSMRHHCSKCAVEYDIDSNAAKNLLLNTEATSKVEPKEKAGGGGRFRKNTVGNAAE